MKPARLLSVSAVSALLLAAPQAFAGDPVVASFHFEVEDELAVARLEVDPKLQVEQVVFSSWEGHFSPAVEVEPGVWTSEAEVDFDLCHEATAEVLLAVVPSVAADGAPAGDAGKVELCHAPPGNPDNAHTIHISRHAAAAHLERHADDHPGPCTGAAGSAAVDLQLVLTASTCNFDFFHRR